MTNKFFSTNLNIEKNLLDLIQKCADTVNLETDRRSYYKENGTLITKADRLVDNIIKKHLQTYYPDIPVISEEGNYNNNDFIKNIYWLIDPIDGTNSYARGKDQFTINIALIEEGIPILGIINHPPSSSTWFGYKQLAYKIKNGSKKVLQTNDQFCTPKIIVSYNLDTETKLFINKINSFELHRFSSSIKFCKIAEGLADFYPRLESINKWDIAAGDAILRAAGGQLLNSELKNYKYNFPSNLTGTFYAVSSKEKWYSLLSKII